MRARFRLVYTSAHVSLARPESILSQENAGAESLDETVITTRI